MSWTSPRWAPALAWPALLCWGGHKLIGQDTYLTLLAGREVANDGLPTIDRLTYWTDQTPWIDQQWGAQLAFYAVHGDVFAMVCAGVTAVALADLSRRRGLILSASAAETAEWQAMLVLYRPADVMPAPRRRRASGPKVRGRSY